MLFCQALDLQNDRFQVSAHEFRLELVSKVRDEGYTLHLHKKLQIRRRHTSQLVTGLVVNDTVNVPRRTRRWLRAVEHHYATGRPASLAPAQLAGWQAFLAMVNRARQAL